MNIIVQDIRSLVSCRPDTTWEREDKDLYSPDFVSGYSFSPVLFARISKAGKCVAPRFAERYFDAVNYGLLLYPETSDGRRLTILDRSSILPFPTRGKDVLESGTNVFEARLDGSVIYSTACGTAAMLEAAIVNASRFVSVRIGDIVAVELAAVSPLFTISGSATNRICGSFCGDSIFDIQIK